PDLTGATLAKHVAVPTTEFASGFADRVTYTFDKTITTPPALALGFMAFLATSSLAPHGAEKRCLVVLCHVNASSSTQVLVDFPDGLLALAVGASVVLGAVRAFSGGAANKDDSQGVSNSATRQTSGSTAGPDLTSVT